MCNPNILTVAKTLGGSYCELKFESENYSIYIDIISISALTNIIGIHVSIPKHITKSDKKN